MSPANRRTVPMAMGRRVRQRARHRRGWSEDGTEIIGKTPCGRAPIAALKMNNVEIVVARRLWVSAGWCPPND